MSRTELEERFFQMYCRQPGTRINDIMTLIESGFSDEDIAAMYDVRNANGNRTCDANDIAVYRKALNGELCKIATYEQAHQHTMHIDRDKQIVALHARGYLTSELSKIFGLNRTRIQDIVRRGLKKKRRPR